MMLPSFFVTIDDSSQEKASSKAEIVVDVQGDFGIKVNLDMVIKDLSIIGKMKKKTGRPIFVDMKMWNGKRTMTEVVIELARQGADMTNLYALSDNMMVKAVAAAKEAGIVILGVTVLTHYDEDYCQKYFRRSLSETVKMLAETALSFGCDGYILPGTTLSSVCNLDGIKFNPAVRPSWYENKKANFQKQIMTPAEAILNGADIVSCGSPIFESENPTLALKLILEEINTARKFIRS